MKRQRLWEQVTESEKETRDLGRRFSRQLAPGSRVGISGSLGSGKTVFVRGICEGLGVPSRAVSSPTFAIVNTYSGRVRVLHVDLYRVSSMEEVEETGLLDMVDSSVLMMEWIDRVPELAELGTICIQMTDLGGQRRRLVADRMAYSSE